MKRLCSKTRNKEGTLAQCYATLCYTSVSTNGLLRLCYESLALSRENNTFRSDKPVILNQNLWNKLPKSVTVGTSLFFSPCIFFV